MTTSTTQPERHQDPAGQPAAPPAPATATTSAPPASPPEFIPPTELAYRKGYHRAVQASLNAILAGCTPLELQDWEHRVKTWRHTENRNHSEGAPRWYAWQTRHGNNVQVERPPAAPNVQARLTAEALAAGLSRIAELLGELVAIVKDQKKQT
jgi:hypothetical protein